MRMADDTTPSTVPRIGAIGSCRVHVPLQHAEAAGLLSYVRHTGFGYVHNPYEIEQIIKLTTGAATRPQRHLSALMAIQKWRTLTPTSFAETSGGADALILELSSIRILRFRGRYLQIHRFREFLKEYGDIKLNAAFFEDHDGARDALMEIADRMPDDWTRTVVEELEFWEMTEDELTASLKRIHDATTQPLTFVNLVTNNFQKQGVRQREMLRDGISAFVAKHDRTRLVDPTAWVNEAGVEDVMLDSSHYAPHYEPVVGRRLAEAAMESLRAVSTPARAAEPS